MTKVSKDEILARLARMTDELERKLEELQQLEGFDTPYEYILVLVEPRGVNGGGMFMLGQASSAEQILERQLILLQQEAQAEAEMTNARKEGKLH